MLDFLFGRLTATDESRPLFEWASKAARDPLFFRAGEVPDTLDGRFAVLATVLALTHVRLDQLGEPGRALSVRLTERFVATMDAEHRELGVGDPSIGKTVRKLVSLLARRVDEARQTVEQKGDWTAFACSGLYAAPPREAAIETSAQRLRALYAALELSSLSDLEQGKVG